MYPCKSHGMLRGEVDEMKILLIEDDKDCAREFPLRFPQEGYEARGG